VYLGVAVIFLLSGLQFFLILTPGDTSLKPVEPGRVHQVVVNRVIDMNFPSFDDGGFRQYLSQLSNRITRRLGFRVRFLIKKTVLVDNYISGDDMTCNSSAARDWFRRHSVSKPCWTGRRNDWLDVVLADPGKRAILAKHYKSRDLALLREKVKKDFLARFSHLANLKNRQGRKLYRESACFRAAAACWAYLLSGQVKSDFIVINFPVFYPSAVTPVDAVTRGGVIYSLIANSNRSLQGVLLMSLFSAHKFGTTGRLHAAVRLSLQGFARLLLRRSFEIRDGRSLLYPVFGGNLKRWLATDRTIVYDKAPVLERF